MPRHQRFERSVDGGGRCAPVFAHDRKQPMRKRERHARQQPLAVALDPLLGEAPWALAMNSRFCFRQSASPSVSPPFSPREGVDVLPIPGGYSMFHTAHPEEQDEAIMEAHEKERPRFGGCRSARSPACAEPASEQKVPRGAFWRKSWRAFVAKPVLGSDQSKETLSGLPLRCVHNCIASIWSHKLSARTDHLGMWARLGA
jgi:hypothetical protein